MSRLSGLSRFPPADSPALLLPGACFGHKFQIIGDIDIGPRRPLQVITVSLYKSPSSSQNLEASYSVKEQKEMMTISRISFPHLQMTPQVHFGADLVGLASQQMFLSESLSSLHTCPPSPSFSSRSAFPGTKTNGGSRHPGKGFVDHL